MIQLAGFKKELDLQVAVVHAAEKAVMAEQNVKLNHMVGTMIEVPRGALTADEIAQTAEFSSFGTNHLTSNPVAADVSPRYLRSLKFSADSRRRLRPRLRQLAAAVCGTGNLQSQPLRLD